MTTTKARSRGDRFAAKVREAYTLGVAEELLLDELASAIDARDARPTTDDTGRRGWAVIVSRLVGQLALPDLGTGEAAVTMDGKSRRAKAASDARWRRERMAG